MGTCLGFLGLFESSPGVNSPNEFEVAFGDEDGFSAADDGCCSAASCCFSQKETQTALTHFVLVRFCDLHPPTLKFVYYFLCKTILKK